MDSQVAAGGAILLVLIIGFLLFMGILWAVMASGYRSYERHQRDRAIERNMRTELADMEASRRAARKILNEYGE